jgi:hypothetical protein
MSASEMNDLASHLDRVIEEARARVMVSDTVAGISFPKHFAAATLEHGGTTPYFVSDKTRREFEKCHGVAP